MISMRTFETRRYFGLGTVVRKFPAPMYFETPVPLASADLELRGMDFPSHNRVKSGGLTSRDNLKEDYVLVYSKQKH